MNPETALYLGLVGALAAIAQAAAVIARQIARRRPPDRAQPRLADLHVLQAELIDTQARLQAAERHNADLLAERAQLADEARAERARSRGLQNRNDELAGDLQACELLIDELQRQYDEDIAEARENATRALGILYTVELNVPGAKQYRSLMFGDLNIAGYNEQTAARNVAGDPQKIQNEAGEI